MLDLRTMEERLRSGYYNCIRLFMADMKWIFDNCRTYNERGTDFYKLSIQMEKVFVNKMKSAGLWYDLNVT